ncbi:MAG: hypothetical protein AB7F28_08405 [Candidatus Margulisiibacteriota bacterium]
MYKQVSGVGIQGDVETYQKLCELAQKVGSREHLGVCRKLYESLKAQDPGLELPDPPEPPKPTKPV